MFVKVEQVKHYFEAKCGRRSGLVVSALDSGSRGPGLMPGRVIMLCSWARHFTLYLIFIFSATRYYFGITIIL